MTWLQQVRDLRLIDLGVWFYGSNFRSQLPPKIGFFSFFVRTSTYILFEFISMWKLDGKIYHILFYFENIFFEWIPQMLIDKIRWHQHSLFLILFQKPQ